jgi:hypothetical protein
MSHSGVTKRLGDEPSAGWTTYGTSRATPLLFPGIVKNNINDHSEDSKNGFI